MELGDIKAQAFAALRGPSVAVVLYGSHVRGRATPESDVDVLQVVSNPASAYRVGPVSVTPYTPNHLRTMAQRGSLFIRHVIDEGVVLHDPPRLIEQVRACFRRPATYGGLRAEVCAASRLLDVSNEGYERRWRKYHSLVAHMVRSYAYSVLADRDELVFDWNDAVRALGAPELVSVIPLARATLPSIDEFRSAIALLAKACGAAPRNEYGTAEALIVNAYGRSPLTVILGLRLLNDSDAPLEYEALEEAGT